MNERKKKFDIFSIGDTTTDVFMGFEKAEIVCEKKGGDCEICFDYAGKMAVDSVVEIDAVGNAANNAIGSARLGLKTGIWTILGDDTNGRQARGVFAAEKVDPSFIETDVKNGTNYSVVLNNKAERTILVYHVDRKYKLPVLPDTKWIYLTSMGKGWEKIIPSLVKQTREKNIALAFNPGTHQLHSGLEELKPLLAVSSLFILNVEEAQKLLGVKDEPKALLDKIAGLGVKTVIITNGAEGTYALQNRQAIYMPIYPDAGPVVERTGCGDSFATAAVAALHRGKSVGEALCWGSANARMVVQYIGAREGLQTRRQIEKTIKDFADIKPRVI